MLYFGTLAPVPYGTGNTRLRSLAEKPHASGLESAVYARIQALSG